ncbi:MAG: hypothetical protein M3536_05885 [Actinomycetota bacterium]|nr:hypothetical protein [Actinomycetota bacterium]
MSENTSTDKPETIDFQVDVTATNGIQVPLRIIVEYPDGYGFYAAKALQAMPENMSGIWNELIQRQDASTIKVMLDSGHVMEDDDEYPL